MADISWIAPEEFENGLDYSEISLVQLGYRCFHRELLILNKDIDLTKILVRDFKFNELTKLYILCTGSGRSKYALYITLHGNRESWYVLDSDEPLQFFGLQVLTISHDSPRELRFWIKPEHVPTDKS